MNTRQPLCIVFDLDDTLYKERDFVRSGRHAVANAFAPVVGLDIDFLINVMDGAEDAFDALLNLPAFKSHGITITDLLNVYRLHKPDLVLPDESREVIEALISAGCQVALITDGRQTTQRNKIAALGLDRIIDPSLIVVSEEIGADKTTAIPFETIMNRTIASKYFYVGDNPAKDFRQARKLGWTTIMPRDVDNVNVHSQDLNKYDEEFRPDIIIDNIKQIITIVPCQQL